ncbi:MAG TPA: hypothetical protein VH092_21785 [Urbifossiella sp.]|nr:hypothetical protein [Urbifossiella sp.]
MNVRRSRSATPRPQTTTPVNLALRPSTAGWYAAWKARKQAGPAPKTDAPARPADDASEAVARWLTGDGK